MSGKKIAIFATTLTILIGGIVVGVILIRQRLLLEKQAAPATTLELVASNSTPSVGENFTVSVDIDTAANLTIGTELYITFNSTKLEAVDINLATFYPGAETRNKAINNMIGTISYVIFLPPQSTPRQGQGTVASIIFKAIEAGSATIDFDPKTLVAAVGTDVGQDVLANTIAETVTIQGTTTPTSSPTPSQLSPTPTGPTTAPSPTPTTSATTLSPTPTTAVSTTSATPTSGELISAGSPIPTIIITSFGMLLMLLALFLFAY